jgi:hypothetical protein
LLYSILCEDAPVDRHDNLQLQQLSWVSRALFRPFYCQNRQPQVHNQRLCEQELESIVVNLESGLKARFLPWLQSGSPEEADRRDKTTRGQPHFFNVAHERLPWYTRAPGLRGVLVESPPLTARPS